MGNFRFIILRLLLAGTFGVVLGRSNGQAQLYVGLGFQAGYFNLPSANEATDLFNSKGYTFRNLRKFHFPTGLRYAASYQANRAYLGLSLEGKRHRTFTQYQDQNGSLTQQDHRFGLQYIAATAGYALSESETFLFYLCGSLDYGWMRYQSRQGNSTNINRVDFFTRRRETFIGTTLSLRFSFRPNRESLTLFSIVPHVQIPFSEFNFREYNQTLNPFDYQTVGVDLPERPINYGVAIVMDLDLLRAIE